MEALSVPQPSLFPIRVRIVDGPAVAIDGLVIDDATTVRLVSDRARSGEDPAIALVEAIEIGARVLDREQTPIEAGFVRREFERTADQVQAAFAAQLRDHLARYFDDESAAAVHHQVGKALVAALASSRQDLLSMFTAEDARVNPLAGFQGAVVGQLRSAGERQTAELRVANERLVRMERELVELRAERTKELAVADAVERSAVKGRVYEEEVTSAVTAIADARGDVASPVGDLGGAGGRKGDMVVELDAAAGACRGRIVIEAKDRRLSRNDALAELDGALAQRDADYAVFVVPTDGELPSGVANLSERAGTKLFVVFDPDEGPAGLELAYALARARVLMAREESDGLDAGAVRAEIEQAVQALEVVRRIKSQLTASTKAIDEARGLLDGMADRARDHLARATRLLDDA